MPKVVSYLRVSTDAQDVSIEVQRHLCRQWYASSNLQGFDYGPELEDKDVSAKIDLFHRPNGQHLLTLLDKGDVLVVAKLSRAFRSTLDALNSMTAFRNCGIRVVILDMNVDTETPVGRLLVTILAAVMEFERELIVERTREALAQRRKEGQWIGSAPPGWRIITKTKRRSKNNELVPDDAERELALYALAQLGNGVETNDVSTKMSKALYAHLHGPDARRTNTKTPGCKGNYFHAQRVLVWAAYALLGFPMMTKAQVREELGFDPFRRAFIVETYPSFVAGEFQPL